MERMGLEVVVIDSPWGEGANEEKLAEILKVHWPPPAPIPLSYSTTVALLSQ